MKLFNDIFSTDFRNFRNFANAPKNNIKTFAIKAYIYIKVLPCYEAYRRSCTYAEVSPQLSVPKPICFCPQRSAVNKKGNVRIAWGEFA